MDSHAEAAQAARNLAHAARLGAIHRTAQAPDLDAAALRQQIAEAAHAIAAADLTTPAAIDEASRAVQGLARVVAQLRASMEARDD